MADNTTINAGTGGDVVRDKDRAGVKTQIVGLDVGIGGTEQLMTSAALADATANPTLPAWAAMGMVFNGTTWDRVRGDTANGIDVDVTRLPGSPAQEHITAASPNGARLSDGAAFYDATKTGQLPSALVGGRLDVNIGASGLTSLPINNVETITDNAAYVDGTSKVFPTGYIFDETAGTALTENDVGAARMDSKRAAVAVIEDATTRGRRMAVSTEGAGLSAGDTAHDSVDAGSPVKTGAKATWPALPTLVASGDRTNNWSDLGGAQIVRKRPVAMYTAQYRLANATAGTRALTSAALTANTNKQMATIYHSAAATKRVQIKYVDVIMNAITVAGLIEWEIVALSATTAPATGNPAITPGKHDQADATAEAACLTLPTTAGSVTAADSPVGFPWYESLGITGTASTAAPPPPANRIVLWDSTADGDGKDLIMRPAVAEGYALNARSTGASQLGFIATIIFTEE